jgi:hypothetical protein
LGLEGGRCPLVNTQRARSSLGSERGDVERVSPSGASQRRRKTTLSQAKVSREREKGRVTGKKRKARERRGDKALSPEKKKMGGHG